jgi:hypothetical protein
VEKTEQRRCSAMTPLLNAACCLLAVSQNAQGWVLTEVIAGRYLIFLTSFLAKILLTKLIAEKK